MSCPKPDEKPLDDNDLLRAGLLPEHPVDGTATAPAPDPKVITRAVQALFPRSAHPSAKEIDKALRGVLALDAKAVLERCWINLASEIREDELIIIADLDKLIRASGVDVKLWRSGVKARRAARKKAEAETAKANRADAVKAEKHAKATRDAASKVAASAAPSTLAEGTADRSELANAERMISLFGSKMLFCGPLKGWHCWNGKHWEQNDGQAARFAKTSLRKAMLEAGDELAETSKRYAVLLAGGDTNGASVAARQAAAATARIKFYEASQSARGVTAMLKLAETEPGIGRLPEELDADLMLLCCQNGTLDLRTGALLPHDPAHLITNISPVAYDPAADCTKWVDFLSGAMGRDATMVDFLQQAAGYSLTGDASEEKLFFAHGPKGTAKSTFVEAVRGLLGSYGKVTSFDTWLHRLDVQAQRPDLARLAGARMVSSSEVEKGRILDDGVVNNATGGEKIQACHKYKDPFDFMPQFKLWLISNFEPRVKDDNSGIWRRIAVLPFTVVIPEADRDPAVKKFFTDPKRGGPAILRWAVEGCLAWQKAGKLAIPERVAAATEAYRANQNPIARFLADCCIIVKGSREAYVLKPDMLRTYQRWVTDSGEHTSLSAAELTQALLGDPFNCSESTKRVTIEGKSQPKPAWFGVRMRTMSDDIADEARRAGISSVAQALVVDIKAPPVVAAVEESAPAVVAMIFTTGPDPQEALDDLPPLCPSGAYCLDPICEYDHPGREATA